jgi:hypothetical protein
VKMILFDLMTSMVVFITSLLRLNLFMYVAKL